MSDPAKTPEEIEDVLASVRRLVSDHTPATASTPEVMADDVPEIAPSLAEALVLTPSFRVTDPEDPWVPVAVSPEAEGSNDADAAANERHVDFANMGASAPDHGDADTEETEARTPSTDDADWQPSDRLASFDTVGDDSARDGSAHDEDPATDHIDAPSDEDLADLIRLDGSMATPADFESETGDDNWPEAVSDAALLTLVARREPPANADQETADEAVSEGWDVDPAEPEAVEAEASIRLVETPDEEQAASSEDRDEGGSDHASGDAEDGFDTHDADDHDAVEQASDDHDAEAEDALEDTDHDDEHVSDAEEDAPTAETDEPEAQDGATVEDLGPTPSPFTFPETEDGILDEDTLREIIVDVVREELQGVLGQRITRNVRKMVRREIRLAMAAEDLE